VIEAHGRRPPASCRLRIWSRWEVAFEVVSSGPYDSSDAQDGAPVVVNRGVLIRYRVMAYTTAVLLIVLVFVGIPLQVAAGKTDVVKVVGTLHGYLYLVYLGVAFDLTRKLRVPLGRMLLVLLAGTVPFCAFVAERKLTRLYDRTVTTPASVGASGIGDQTGR
jgi:integral membrane protein